MPTYSYTSKSLEGKSKIGDIEAEDKTAVARYLRSEGFVPIKIEAKRAGKKSGGGEGAGGSLLSRIAKLDVGRALDAVGLGGVPLSDKIMFSRHLAVMISAGVPISRALEVLSKQTKNTRFKAAILSVREDIRKGERIADSLAKHPKAFDTLYVSMARAGDSAGNLTEILELLAEHLKKEHDLRSRVRGALMYPSVIVVAMLGIGALMMTMVVPKIADIFQDLDAELPFLTQVIIGISNFISAYWPVILASIPAFIYIAKKLLSTQGGKRGVAWVLLKTPIFRTLTRKINSARFARTMSSLVEGGVPILEGLRITRDTLSNVYYREAMDKMYKDAKAGKPLFESISKFENIFPALITQMVRVGEESGALGDVLGRIAEFYEEEVDAATKNLSSIIEPILMLIIGAIVGIFAISMIQPMYSLMGNL